MTALKKLTVPQALLLVDISERPEEVFKSYRPGRRLVQLGYAISNPTGRGHVMLSITDKGSEALRNG